MLSRKMAGLVCLLVVPFSSCTPSTADQLRISTPRSTLEIPMATKTLAAASTSTSTPLPTTIPRDAILPANLHHVQLLHEFWGTVATAAGIDPYEMDISAIAVSPQGRYLAVGGCSKPLEADLRSGNIYCNGEGEGAEGIAGIPFLLILDTNAETVVAIVPEDEAGTTIANLVFTHDSEKLIYAVQPGKFAIWDINSSQVESVLWEGVTSAPRIAVSPDGKWIAIKPSDQVLVWDTALQEFVAEIPGYFRPQFSADSSQMLVYRDEEFIFYQTGTWTESQSFGIPCECVYAFSPDFSLFAASESPPAENAPIVVWDVSTGERVQSLDGKEGFTAFLLFSPDGKMLWRARERGDLMAWSTSDWQFLAEQIGGITPIFNLHGFQFVDDGRNYLLFSDLHLGLYGLP